MRYRVETVGAVFLLFLLAAQPAFAQEVAICPKSTSDFNFSVLCALQPQNAFPALLTFILIAAVVIALAYLIWGGIKWIMSGGDKGNVETARNTIVSAVIGLIIVFLSWFIINFILTTFFGKGLGSGIALPAIFNGNPPPVPTPTPVVLPTQPVQTVTATPTPAPDTNVQSEPIPLCPTAYPPDYICKMPPDSQ